MEISRAVRPVRCSSRSSLSMNGRPSRLARRMPTVDLPEAISPTNTMWPGAFTNRGLSLPHAIWHDRVYSGFRTLLPIDFPFMRVPPARVYFPEEDRAEILARIDQALTTGQLTLGATGRELEAEFDKFTIAPRGRGDGSRE